MPEPPFKTGRVSPHGIKNFPGQTWWVENPQSNDMKSNNIRTTILVLTTALLALIGSGCRTVSGFGGDVGAVGGHIQDATR
jgi:predicted small secreted protein